jgi:hypothetical protein
LYKSATEISQIFSPVASATVRNNEPILNVVAVELLGQKKSPQQRVFLRNPALEIRDELLLELTLLYRVEVEGGANRQSELRPKLPCELSQIIRQLLRLLVDRAPESRRRLAGRFGRF